ncbi:helix-hairpin-helix domain-containing protein [bacterium]|nr:helix-hairpin-helix domain-containing protein [bacterium]
MKLTYKDFNKMGGKELAKLQGIGKKTVQNIFGMRPFRSNDDLFKVRGLGKNTLMKLGIEKSKKKRKKWIDVDGVMYPHYSFAFHEITGVMDFFWRIPREFRLYYGKEEESREITARIQKYKDANLEKL